MSSKRWSPSHSDFVPGSPSPLRPRKPPSEATICMACRSDGGSAGVTGFFVRRPSVRSTPPPRRKPCTECGALRGRVSSGDTHARRQPYRSPSTLQCGPLSPVDVLQSCNRSSTYDDKSQYTTAWRTSSVSRSHLPLWRQDMSSAASIPVLRHPPVHLFPLPAPPTALPDRTPLCRTVGVR